MSSDALLRNNTKIYFARYNGTYYVGLSNLRAYLRGTLPRTLKGLTRKTDKPQSYYTTSNGYKYILPLNLLRNEL